MKIWLFLPLFCFSLFYSCSSKKRLEERKIENPYKALIGLSIKDSLVQVFLRRLGSNYEYDDQFGPHYNYYTYKDKGIILLFNEINTLQAIWFKNVNFDTTIVLPYNIKMYDTREMIETKLGKADIYKKGHVSDYLKRGLSAFYYYNRTQIEYKSVDTSNLNNPIKEIYVGEMDSVALFKK